MQTGHLTNGHIGHLSNPKIRQLPDAHEHLLLYTGFVERGLYVSAVRLTPLRRGAKYFFLLLGHGAVRTDCPVPCFTCLVLKVRQKIGRPYNTKMLQLPDALEKELRYD
jgi:hypothetical protein